MMHGNSNFKYSSNISPKYHEGKQSKTTGVGSSSAFKPYGNTGCSPVENFHFHNSHPYFNMGE